MQDDGLNPAVAAALVLALPVLFVATWVGVVTLLAHVGGWARLARHYRTFDSFGGEPIRFQFGYLGFARYKGVLTFGTEAKGLYIATLLLFRPGHPPLVVPWGQLSAERIAPDRIALSFKDVPGVVLKVTRRLGERVLAGRHLLPEEPR